MRRRGRCWIEAEGLCSSVARGTKILRSAISPRDLTQGADTIRLKKAVFTSVHRRRGAAEIFSQNIRFDVDELMILAFAVARETPMKLIQVTSAVDCWA